MSPRPSVKAERRRQILDAAMVCFAREGYHLTTMDEIAAEFPFSKGLLYYYFDSKRDLFLAIMENWMEESLKAWEAMLSPGDDATTTLCKFLRYGTQLVAQSTGLARVQFEFYGELGRDPAISGAFKSLFAEFRTKIKNILDAGIRSGEFRPLDTLVLASVLFGAYEGLVVQGVVEPDRLDWPAVSDSLCEMVRHGIALKTEG